MVYDFCIMYGLGYCIFVAIAFKVCKYVPQRSTKANRKYWYLKCEIKHTKLNEALEAKLITCILLYITTKATKNSNLKHIHIFSRMRIGNLANKAGFLVPSDVA